FGCFIAASLFCRAAACGVAAFSCVLDWLLAAGCFVTGFAERGTGLLVLAEEAGRRTPIAAAPRSVLLPGFASLSLPVALTAAPDFDLMGNLRTGLTGFLAMLILMFRGDFAEYMRARRKNLKL